MPLVKYRIYELSARAVISYGRQQECAYAFQLSAAETEKCKSLSAPHEQDDNALFYGESVPTRPYDEEHFAAKIEVDPSSTFYGWVFKFMGGIQIIAPQECVEEMKRIARSFL